MRQIEELQRVPVYGELLVGKLHRVHSSRRHHLTRDVSIENFAANYADPVYLVNVAEN